MGDDTGAESLFGDDEGAHAVALGRGEVLNGGREDAGLKACGGEGLCDQLDVASAGCQNLDGVVIHSRALLHNGVMAEDFGDTRQDAAEPR
ncbi:hypothetical protein ACPOL_4496 [Acidisarcina polymorpha]|uniref:Uncharacterized protein n=1 Tax=Acidisarcina polymorpha TaxID=2211140 RepID=A0A2Z5G3T7_9BACT|nr:hypothetical protein ACPOL_4496 [Acidisarcina polymorpha]